MRRPRLPIVCLILVLQGLLAGGCSNILARRIVTAPNANYPEHARQDLPKERLADLHVDEQLRVPVGPPDAVYSVWVSKPSKSTHNIELVASRVDGAPLKVIRKPATRPATASSRPTTQPRPVGTIVILPGIHNRKEWMPYIMLREMYGLSGYQCVLVDLRGHGRSTGQWMTYGVLESRDLVQVLDELTRRGLAPGKVGVVGLSYGAAVAIQWAAIDPRVKAVVALEPFTDLQSAMFDASRVVLGGWRWLFTDATIHTAIAKAGALAGFNPADASALRAIRQSTQPILIMHSNDDELISVNQAKRLHEAAGERAKLVLVDKQSHFNFWQESATLISNSSLTFFSKHLLQRPSTKPVVAESPASQPSRN